MHTKRADIVEKILSAKLVSKTKWSDLAKAVGQSKEWTTAALLGQMPLTEKQLEAAGKVLGLSLTAEETAIMCSIPARGSLGTAVPTDPLIYRFYELIQVYGTTFKALIEEEFGDGIMSAIDFTMDIDRKNDPKGDRVVVTLNGKFLPYKPY